MHRSIIILSPPRSGSSALAGALHEMGVNMGAGFFQPIDRFNAKGYFEDMRWKRAFNSSTGHRYTIRQPKGLPEKFRRQYLAAVARSNSSPVWGVKNPRMPFVFNLIKPMIEAVSDMRVIVLSRDQDQIIRSLQHHSENAYGGKYEMREGRAAELINIWITAIEELLEDTYKIIDYNNMLDDPLGTMELLRDYCFDGYKKYAKSAKKAAKFIDPELNHETINSDIGFEESTEDSEESIEQQWT